MIIFNRNIFFVFMFSCIVTIGGCTKKESISSDDLAAQLTGSSWSIHYYYDGTDNTNDFSGYIFNFKSDGSCSIKKGNNTSNGVWQVVREGNTTQKLQLNISSNPTLEQLNEWWKLQDISYNLVEFITDDISKNKQFHFIRL